eukprot:evm.model.scf_78.6 EVM.evm.TU.scf_78.6   scf_78:112625-113491(-)
MLNPRTSPAHLAPASGAPGQRLPPLSRPARSRRPPSAGPSDATAADSAGTLRGAESLLANAETCRSAPGARGSDAADKPRLVLHCDVSGCTVAPVVGDGGRERHPEGTVMGALQQEGGEAGPRDLVVMEGRGWKLGLDRGRGEGDGYSAFVGGDAWSMCLSREEFADFVRQLRNLRRSVATLSVCGSWDGGGGESTLEVRGARVWMQGRAPNRRLSMLRRLWGRRPPEGPEGLPDAAFALRFVVASAGAREAEGSFPPEAVMEILRAIGGGAGGREDMDEFAFEEVGM